MRGIFWTNVGVLSKLVGALGVVSVMGVASSARADLPPVDEAPRDDFVTLPLASRHDKHWARASLEVGAVVGIGIVDYLLNTSARGGTTRPGDSRWDLRYDWPTLRGKLTGADIALDGNRMGTNYASHPFAGTLYYTAARSNHLTFAESFLFAVIGSSVWEMFGEIRETTSLNDLVVTPVGGAAIGEATMQMAGFFDRGEKRLSNGILSALFSPVKAVNDATDDAVPERTSAPDALGFATEPWHRFSVRAGVGVTSQASASPSHPRASYADIGLDVDLALASLPGYAGAAERSRVFDDGNVSSIRFTATASEGKVVDARFETRVLPVGFYTRSATRDMLGNVFGHGTILGLRIGFEYGTHTWDRDGAFARGNDAIALASPLGLAFEHVWDAGDVHVKTGVDLYGSMAGVTSYALSGLRTVAERPGAGLPTTLKTQGYYHAYTLTAAPAVSVVWRRVSIGARMRLDTFRPIEGADEEGRSLEPIVRLRDSRTEIASSLALRVPGSAIELGVTGTRRSRVGYAGALGSSRTEASAMATLGVVF